jgi:hypothetical protein
LRNEAFASCLSLFPHEEHSVAFKSTWPAADVFGCGGASHTLVNYQNRKARSLGEMSDPQITFQL